MWVFLQEYIPFECLLLLRGQKGIKSSGTGVLDAWNHHVRAGSCIQIFCKSNKYSAEPSLQSQASYLKHSKMTSEPGVGTQTLILSLIVNSKEEGKEQLNFNFSSEII